MTTAPRQHTPEWYMNASRQYIRQAEVEFELEDYRQAGKKAWGAVASAVKFIAQQRGWRHEHHRSISNALREVADEFAGDFDSSQVKLWLTYAEALHINFYEGDLTAEDVADGLDKTKILLAVLQTISSEPPRYIPGRSNTQKARWEYLTGLNWDETHPSDEPGDGQEAPL